MRDTSQIADSIVRLLADNQLPVKKARFFDAQIIFRPQDRADDFFIVESGEVRAFSDADGGQRLLDIFGPNTCFGFSALGKLPSYGKTTQSVGETTLNVIPADYLRQLMASDANLSTQFIEVMARQLYLAWAEGSELVYDDCRLRLIKTLLRFRNSPAARAVPGGTELHMTHAQLAQAVGAARETVSLCLMQLRAENLVQTGRNRVIFDAKQLLQFDPKSASGVELAIAV